MKTKVMTLNRRKDKLGGFKAMALHYGYWDKVSIHIGHDGQAYPTPEAIIEDMAKFGWVSESNWGVDTVKKGILPDKIPEYGVVNPRSHFGIRWTYLDLLKEVCETQEDTLILMDDQFLVLQWHVYEDILTTLKDRNGNVLALDPVHENRGWYATELISGYHGFTEEAILWTPEGAEKAIDLLQTYGDLIIGDIIRRFWWKGESYSTPFQTAKHIGSKTDWESDVHLGHVN